MKQIDQKLPDSAASPQAPQRVQSQTLLGEAKALLIMHNGREYQLRLTQNGKLILTA
jgi:hemin uptake protein HemP